MFVDHSMTILFAFICNIVILLCEVNYTASEFNPINGWGIMAAGCVQNKNQVSLSEPPYHEGRVKFIQGFSSWLSNRIHACA